VRVFLFSLLVSLSSAWAAPTAADENAALYYQAQTPFNTNTHFETALNFGYLFSDPYFNIATATVGGYYLFDRTFALGLEGTGYASWRSRTGRGMDDDLGPYGFSSHEKSLHPQASGMVVARFTPISGMVNFFSSEFVLADISFLARAGGIKYRNLSPGPVVGTGLVVHLGFSPTWGVESALIWDGEKPPGRNWQSRVSFRAGPTVRF